jgi:hypothetical protein
MTTFDYLLNIALIGLVVLQIRGRRLDRRALVLPLVLVTWAGSQYLHGIPTAGNDLALIALAVAVGLSLGISSGLLTRVEVGRDGVAVARATLGAAVLLATGISARLAFSLYAEHGGGPGIARFSIAHHLTPSGWVTALVLMAFAEVVSRTLTLWARMPRAGRVPAMTAA